MKKIPLSILASVILWVVLSIVSVCYLTQSPKAYETTKKIWVPEKYSIVNQIDGNYTPVWDVHLSGTAIYVPFQSFRENFASKNIDVIIQTDGLVYYIAREAERKFFAKLDYAPSDFDRSHSVEIMIGDLAVKSFYGWDSNIILESMMIAFFCGFVITGFYWIYCKVVKTIKSIKTKAT